MRTVTNIILIILLGTIVYYGYQTGVNALELMQEIEAHRIIP